MGASYAKSQIDSAVNDAITETNNNNQNCTNKNVGQNSVFINCNNIIGNTITITSNDFIDISCLQNVNISEDVQTSIINDFKNAASAAVGVLGAGYADAEAIVNTSVNLGIAMTSSALQTCANDTNVKNEIVLNCSTASGQAVDN